MRAWTRNAGSGDPAWDLVTLSLWDPDRLPILLDAYRRLPGFVAHVLEVKQGYRILRHLSMARWHAEQGSDPGPDLDALRHLA